MKNLLLLAFTLVVLKTHAADIKYPVSAIPAPLKENANVVKRMEDFYFEIKGNSEAVVKRKFALTILNEKGDAHAALVLWYDKFRQIRSIEGCLYDAQGRLLKKLKSKDIKDQSAVDNNNLMDDSRVKSHNFYHTAYPYTVEYELEIKQNHTYSAPSWVPQNSQQLSVEKSSFTLVTPQSYNLRNRIFNYKGEPVVTTEGSKRIAMWQVAALPAISLPFAPPRWHELTTVMYTAPTDFEMDGYKGNMSSWQEFGKFSWTLNKGRDVLPDNVMQTVQQLTAPLADEKEKVKALYEYMQKTTRYISIQLGIGGLQPFPAADVAKKGYGDCKALSNYMYSLLKAAGIRSHYALVRAGRSADDRFMLDDFSYDPFNHVILCVPLKKDTVWLECTSQSTPAGYMGGFTGNRKALLIGEEGGTLVNTPWYGLQENLQVRSVKGTIDGEGNLDAKVTTVYEGLQQDNLQSMLSQLSKDRVKKMLNEEFDLATYDINDFKYEEKKGPLPQIKEDLDLTVSHYATISGKRLFITPNVLNRSKTRIEEDKRLFDFEFGNAYYDADSIEIEIPKGYEPEALPQDVNLKTRFGTYSSTCKVINHKIVYYRVIEHFAGKFPAADQAELAKYYAAIYKADNNRVVLVKKEP